MASKIRQFKPGLRTDIFTEDEQVALHGLFSDPNYVSLLALGEPRMHEIKYAEAELDGVTSTEPPEPVIEGVQGSSIPIWDELFRQFETQNNKPKRCSSTFFLFRHKAMDYGDANGHPPIAYQYDNGKQVHGHFCKYCGNMFWTWGTFENK